MQTTTQAARELGIARRTVQKWCAILGFERVGRDYVLTVAQVQQIAERAHDKPGRPKSCI